MTQPLSIALVYPPFGPSGLPSLGLGLFAARFRAQDRKVAVDYWNLRVLSRLPYDSVRERDLVYRRLSGGALFPWNEWAYRQAAYGLPGEDDLPFLRAELTDADADLVLTLAAGAEADVAETARRLARYDLVGIASTFHQILPAVALARAIKAIRPDAVTVLGGANADAGMAAGHLRLHRAFDFAIAGEADTAFPALLAALEGTGGFGDIPGLAWRSEDGTVRADRPPEMVADLDALPCPDYSDYLAAWREAGLDRVNRLAVALESSRGCWWGEHSHCVFCGLNAQGMAYRQKDYGRFAAEVQEAKARYGNPLFFMADNILSTDYVRRFRERQDDEADVEYFYEIKSNLRRDQVEDLARAGVTMVQPGIESLSTPVLKLMRKGLRGIQNIAFLKYAADTGLRPVYNIISGFPGEDPSDARRMIAALPQLFHLFPPTSAPLVEFHRFSPYHAAPERYGLTLEPDPRYRRIFPFATEDIAELAYRFVSAGQRLPDYLPELVQALSDWRRAHASGRARLFGRPVPDGLLLTDSRAPGTVRHTLLAGFAQRLHAVLDRPHSRASLMAVSDPAADRRTAPSLSDYLALLSRFPDCQVVWFEAKQFRADPESCLEMLVDAGLLYVEAEPGQAPLYLSLATAAEPMQAMPRLDRLGI